MLPSDYVAIRIAGAADAARVLSAYAALGYRREINPLDTVWLAERAGEVAGIVRISAEHGTLVLRGMRIAEPFQRQRIGTRMLEGIAAWLEDRACYCVPYSHLIGFYGQAGFREIDPSAAPPFLAERFAEYRRSGVDIVLMLRPGRPA